MTSIAEWAEILLPVCDALGYESFSVLGISAGAPYSYAIAARAPQRVRAVAIASGLGQVNDDAVLAHYPPEARELLHRFRTESYDEVAAFWLDYVRQVAARFEPGDRWYDLVVATGAHKAAGPTREAVLQQRPWGFALDAIECPGPPVARGRRHRRSGADRPADLGRHPDGRADPGGRHGARTDPRGRRGGLPFPRAARVAGPSSAVRTTNVRYRLSPAPKVPARRCRTAAGARLPRWSGRRVHTAGFADSGGSRAAGGSPRGSRHDLRGRFADLLALVCTQTPALCSNPGQMGEL